METIVRKRIAHILKYMVVQQQLGWGKGIVVFYLFVYFFFLLGVIIFYTSCVTTAALKTDAQLTFSH